MRILAFPSPSQARHYRLDQVAKYINQQSANEMVVSSGPLDESAATADVLVMQQTTSQEKISYARALATQNKQLLVAELDDYFGMNEDNPFKPLHDKLNAEHWLEVLCGVADIVTTTTPYLAQVIKARLAEHGTEKPVIVLPNALDMAEWELPILKNYSDEIRIVWAGSCTHQNDLRHVKAIIERICGEFPQVKFLYAGDVKLKDMFKDINSEYIDGVEIEAWPQRLHSLRADIAIAPLVDTPFNRCKSNLKYLEYGICGIPGVYSETVYKETVKGGLLAKDPEEFYTQLVRLIKNPELRDRLGVEAYIDVKTNYSIEKTALKWLNTYWRYLTELRPYRLDIGGGLSHILGGNYINVDADPRYAEIRCDLVDGIPVADYSIEKVHASAILEHFYPSDLSKVLQELHRVMVPGGRLYVAVPDWQKIRKSDNWPLVQMNLYGRRHQEIPIQHDIHKYCFDYPHVEKVLKKAGFTKIKEIPYEEKIHDPQFTLACEAYA